MSNLDLTNQAPKETGDYLAYLRKHYWRKNEVDEIHAQLGALNCGDMTHDDVSEVTQKLLKLTVGELKALKAKLGLPAAPGAAGASVDTDLSNGQDRGNPEGGAPPAARGGRPRLAASQRPEDKAKLNVYELIRAIKDNYPSWGKKELHKHFKNHKDFKDLVTRAKLNNDVQMFHNALKWMKANPIVGHETQSPNVS